MAVQVQTDEEPEVAEPEILTVVGEMPFFSGSNQELLKFMAGNTRYHPMARENCLQGNVFFTFFVAERDALIKDKSFEELVGVVTKRRFELSKRCRNGSRIK